MHYLITILDFVLLSWAFFLIVPVALITSYYTIDRAVNRDADWPGWPAFWLLVVGAAVAYRYPSLRLTDWHSWVWVGLSYVGVGFLVALYKWVAVLVAFRKLPVAAKIAATKLAVSEEYGARLAPDLMLDKTVERLERIYPRHVVETQPDGLVTIYPDWRKHPIGSWLSYWPMFALSIPLDWLTRLSEWIMTWLRQFWDGIARHFSVRG